METVVRHTRPADRKDRTARPAPRRREGERRTAISRFAPKNGRIYAAARVSTLQYAMYMVLAVFAITLYVGHVHATDALMADTQAARQENLRLHLTSNQLKGDFDHLTGPSVILEQARMLGLVEGYRYGQTIVVVPSE